jgi:hypothetical protein
MGWKFIEDEKGRFIMAYWTEIEYDTVINAYCKMWLAQEKGNSVDVSQVVKECTAALNDSRSYNAVRRRFSNISYVFSMHGLPHVNNLNPLDHISDTCAEFIWNKAQKRLKTNKVYRERMQTVQNAKAGKR